MAEKSSSLFDRKLFGPAVVDAFRKLDPRFLVKNPVMFITAIGALLTTFTLFGGGFSGFNFQIALWLWFTVLFANFSEAIAEGRGKAQAESLRKSKTTTIARLLKGGKESSVNASDLRKGDFVVCETNDLIPGDGEVTEGIATVDESAITGESAPVVREAGGDRSAVTGGTRVLSDRVVIRISAEPGDGFIDRMIRLVEGTKRQKTPNEIALNILLAGLTIIFLLAVASLKLFADYSAKAAGQDLSAIVTMPVLIALLVCLIPTTIGGLLSAIGISGMDRLIRKNVIATSGRAVEAAGDIDVLLHDHPRKSHGDGILSGTGRDRERTRRAGPTRFARGRNPGRAFDRRFSEGDVFSSRRSFRSEICQFRTLYGPNPNERNRSP
jgi:K+-transporting ATPase ATPase B chain